MSLGSQPAARERELFPAPARLDVLRVCHILSGDLWAGAEVQAAALLAALARRPEISISAILLNEGVLAQKLRADGIDVVVIPESEHGFLGIINEAARCLRSRPVDILHSHRYKENLLAAFLARRCGIPFLVSTRHGAGEPFAGWKRIKHAAIGYLDDLTARHAADRIISVSDELRNHLRRRIPAERITTIRNGIDTTRVRSKLSRSEAKRRLGIPESTQIVGYAGRLVPVKRLDIFLETAKALARADSGACFVIAGDGPEQDRLKALARRLDLEGHIRFLGFREDIYDVMRAFDLFLLCSDHEGLPICILEALCLGIPVVARAVGGVPEVIENGVTGILSDLNEPPALAEACRGLLQDDLGRKRMAAAGEAHLARSFSSGRTADLMIGVYRALAESK